MPMENELTVGQVMAPIEEYNTVAAEAPLCDALFILKANLKRIESGEKGPLHKTLLAVDPSGQIIGLLSIFDLVRGLVPERAKEPAVSRTFYRSLSDRQLNVADEMVNSRSGSTGWITPFWTWSRPKRKRKSKRSCPPSIPCWRRPTASTRPCTSCSRRTSASPWWSVTAGSWG